MNMSKPYAWLESEADQMEEKARAARMEAHKLIAIADTCEEQAKSLRWAINKQRQEDAERSA